MADLSVLKQLKERIDKIAEERNNIRLQEQADKLAMEQAMELQMHSELLGAVKENTRKNDAMLQAIQGMKIEVPKIDTPIIPPVEIPEIKVPDIHIPEIKVPPITVNVPKIELPTINVPEPRVTVNVEKSDPPIIPPFPEIPPIVMPDRMTVQGEVSLAGINPLNPLPVKLIGNYPTSSGSGGPRNVKATIQDPDENYGTMSNLNTTTTPLGSSASYTGTFEQNRFPDVMVSCITDNTGTLYFDFSVDGTNVNTFPTNGFVIASGTHEFHIARKGARYFRARLVNDSGVQTYLRLYTYFGVFGQAMAPLNQSTSTDADAILVRSAYDPLEASQGKITGVSAVNKFGQAPSGVQTSLTDIWARADSTPTQQIWLAPTAARVHAIVSSSTSDDGSPVGVGARTIRVSGLTSWTTAETSEDVTLDGTTPVNTVNSYVIIHRMKVLTSGATSINVGTITATAATDGTITALILPSKGQTQLAIYGIPSIQTLYLTNYDFTIHDTGGTAKAVDVFLVVNENPNVQTTNFITKINGGVNTAGNSHFVKEYNPYLKIPGPAIIKAQGLSSAADTDCSANFDGYLITN